MKDFTVTYSLEDEEIARLENLAAAYKEKGFNATQESVFNAVMLGGSKWDINDKLAFAEWQAGLITDVELDEKRQAWKKERAKK